MFKILLLAVAPSKLCFLDAKVKEPHRAYSLVSSCPWDLPGAWVIG